MGGILNWCNIIPPIPGRFCGLLENKLKDTRSWRQKIDQNKFEHSSENVLAALVLKKKISQTINILQSIKSIIKKTKNKYGLTVTLLGEGIQTKVSYG